MLIGGGVFALVDLGLELANLVDSAQFDALVAFRHGRTTVRGVADVASGVTVDDDRIEALRESAIGGHVAGGISAAHRPVADMKFAATFGTGAHAALTSTSNFQAVPHRGQPVAVLAVSAWKPQRQTKRHTPSFLSWQQAQMVIGGSAINFLRI